MACLIKDNCSFFNNKMRMMEERKKIIKLRFCLSIYTQCARFKVYSHFKSQHKIPADLYPNHFEQASELIQNDKKHDKRHRKE